MMSREEREVGAVLYSTVDSKQQRGWVLLRRKEAQERSPDRKETVALAGLDDRSDSCGDLLVAAWRMDVGRLI